MIEGFTSLSVQCERGIHILEVRGSDLDLQIQLQGESHRFLVAPWPTIPERLDEASHWASVCLCRCE